MKRKILVFAGIFIISALMLSSSMGTTYSSFLGGKDVKWWDGVSRTFTRLTSTGGSLTLNKIGTSVDALEVYGSGTSYTSATINSAIGAIGTNNAVLELQPGTWAITENVTVPKNITLKVPQGVTLAVSTGITLTINGDVDAGVYQIYSLTGTGAITYGNASGHRREVYPSRFGAVCDGATDDEPEFLAAINSCPSRGCVIIVPGSSSTCLMGSTLDVGTKDHISFRGDYGTTSTLKADTGVSPLLEISGGGTTRSEYVVENIRFDSSASQTGTGILVNDAIQVWIRNNYFSGFAAAIDLGTSGTGALSQVWVESNSMATNKQDITINDTMTKIYIRGNISTDSTGAGALIEQTTGALTVSQITDNQLVAGSGTGSGIKLVSSGTSTDNIISNNFVHGGSVAASTNGIDIQDGTGSIARYIIEGNHVLNWGHHGIYVDTLKDGVISGNESYSNSKGTGDGNTYDGIYCNNCENVAIVGNSANDVETAASRTQRYGMYLANPTNLTVTGNNVSRNSTDGTNDTYGMRIGGAGNYEESGNLYGGTAGSGKMLDNSNGATSGTGEDTLKTITITADSMAETGGLKVFAAGIKTNGSSEAKTIKFYFGSTTFTPLSAVTTATDWRLEVTIYNTANNAQRISWIAWDGATITQGYETGSENTTANVTMKTTGEVAATGTDVITQTMWHVERLGG